VSRIRLPSPDQAPAESQTILNQVGKTLGFVPNLHRLMSISPATLAGWFGLMGSLAKTLDVKTRDGIALAVSQVNGCDYCLAAHSHVSSALAKIPDDEIARNREGKSSDPKREAAIQFARRVVEARGKVTGDHFAAVRAAGYTDPQIVEIIALSAQFQMTNFLNNANGTVIDFPPAATA
jgi:uncharacterized peroxidase-related enzyme